MFDIHWNRSCEYRPWPEPTLYYDNIGTTFDTNANDIKRLHDHSKNPFINEWMNGKLGLQ